MKIMNWRVTIVLLTFSVLGCASTTGAGPKLPGSSLADSMLQRDTVPLVAMYEAVADTECGNAEITDTQVLTIPDVWGTSPWQEKWTVDRCGDLIFYTVTYKPTPGIGGTDISVSPMEDEPDEVHAAK